MSNFDSSKVRVKSLSGLQPATHEHEDNKKFATTHRSKVLSTVQELQTFYIASRT
jgi:hypothetical protein